MRTFEKKKIALSFILQFTCIYLYINFKVKINCNLINKSRSTDKIFSVQHGKQIATLLILYIKIVKKSLKNIDLFHY
jgi:hypothetical protein